MDNIISDAIRFRIREQNAARQIQHDLIANVTCGDIKNIIANYCGEAYRFIDEEVAVRCIKPLYVNNNNHILSVLFPFPCSIIVLFNYDNKCEPNYSAFTNITHESSWENYIEFILTGYNVWIFQHVTELVKYPYIDKFEKPQYCIHGNPRQLAEKLLGDLRSEILGD